MQRLLSMLDEEVRTLSNLVACVQREQQHLMAFEPEALEPVVAEKQRLLDREDGLRTVREQHVRELLRERGVAGESLSHLTDALSDAAGAPLRDRRDNLRALLAALAELNAASGAFAVRQLRWARGCRRRLTGQTGEPAYNRSGEARQASGTGLRLSACV